MGQFLRSVDPMNSLSTVLRSEKSQRKLARLHAHIKNIRKDWTHKITTKIARENQTICLEDLNVKGMISSTRDVGFYEIRRQLEYKSKIYPTARRVPCSEVSVVSVKSFA